MLFSKSVKSLSVITSFLLGACNSVVSPPVEQIHQAQKNNQNHITKVNKQIELKNTPKIIQYLCKNDKKVEVEYQKTAKPAKKQAITVSFQGSSYPLSSVVTKDGKKYTNIRWTWHEPRKGNAFLYDNTKKTLAENCVKQP